MDEEEIANLNFKSATDHLYNVPTESTEWVTLDIEDPNKKYMLNGNAYNARWSLLLLASIPLNNFPILSCVVLGRCGTSVMCTKRYTRS